MSRGNRISALIEELKIIAAEQEAQIEEISALNGQLAEASAEKQERIDELEVAAEVHYAIGSGDWQMAFDEEGNMSSCTWSDRFREMVGFESTADFPDELESWADRLHPEDKGDVLACYWDTVNDLTGATTYDVRYRLLTKQGAYRWFRATGRLTRRRDGSPVKFYGMFLDIHDQTLYEKKLEDSVAEQEAQIEEISALNERLEEVSAEQEAQIEEISALNGQLAEASAEKQERIDELEVAAAIHDAIGSGDWQMAFDEEGNMSSCTWSDHFREMVGFESTADFPDELESWADRLHPEDKGDVLACYWDTVNDLTGATTYDVRYRLLTKQGAYRWFRATGRLTRRRDGSPVKFYGMFLDIDDQMRYQSRLEESVAEQEAQIEEISALNEQLEEVSAEQEAQIEEISALNGRLEEVSAEQEAQIEEISALNEQLQDASAEKQARIDELEVAAEVHYAIGSGDWQMAFDEEGNMSSCTWSDRFREMVGFESTADFPDELESWADRLHPEDKDGVLACYWDTVNDLTGATTYDVRYRLLTKQGAYRWYRATGRLTRRRDGSPVKFYGMFLDIHDQVLYENKLADARKAAEDANDAKTSFLFNMSHDIRTPMNAIIGFTNLLEKHQENPDKRADYLRKIEDSSHVLLSIINNVLEMARIEKGHCELDEKPWALGGISRSLRDTYQPLAAEKGINLSVSVETGDIAILCDEVKMREVLDNLVSNAIKYTNPGGSVTLKLEALECNRPGWILARATVADTGIGMSEEFLPHLFEEFSRERSTATANTQGTGLGMSIVKRLVELMGGTVTVTSQKGIGSTFVVEIEHQLVALPECDPAEDENDWGSANFADKRILLVEDNDLNAEIAIEILSEANFDIDRAEDGAVAVRMLEEAEPGRYDVVLMDIQMPNMNGYEATKAIRAFDDETKAHMPILAMTANAFEEDKRAALRAGMDGHIVKPVDVTKLMRMLAGVLE